MDSVTDDRDFERQFNHLPDSAWDRVLEACEQFESAWEGNAAPESFLTHDAESQRLCLLKLLAIDLEKRIGAGQPIDYQAYAARFPGHDDIVRRAFSLIASLPRYANDSTIGGFQNAADDTHKQDGAFPELDNYEVLGVVGRGGMGIVYQARQKKPDRIVALKMISSSVATPDMIDRFRIEADLAAKLEHPNIISVYEVNDHRGCPFFSMQYLECRSLKELHEHPLADQRACEYVCAIANAVQHAHEQGVLHRDIKPSNILIDRAGVPWLTDFGVAKRITGDSELTVSGQVLGTPSFMPPEQAQGKLDQIDGRSDVYSLGAVLYSLLTGHAPFEAADSTETLRQVIHNEPIRPRQLNPAISRDIETICLKCLEKKPQLRYASARALEEDLRRFLNGEPIHARPAGLLERTYRWCRRKPAHAFATGMLAMVFVLVGAFAMQTAIAVRRERQAANTEKNLRAEAQRMGYMAEVGLAFRRYENLLQDPRSSAVTAFSAKSIEPSSFHYYTTSLSNRIASWETAWLNQLTPGNPVLVGRLSESDWRVIDLDVSPDRSRAVSVDASGVMLVWDVKSGRVVRRLVEGRSRTEPTRLLHHFLARDRATSVADWGACFVDVQWLDPRRIVAVSLDGSAAIFDAETGEMNTLIEQGEPLYCVAVGRERILVGDRQGGLTLRSIDGQELKRVATTNQAVMALHWLNQAKKWVAGFENGTVLVLDAESLKVLDETEVEAPVWSLAATEAGKTSTIAIAGHAPLPVLVTLRDASLQITRSVTQPDVSVTGEAIHHVRFSRDGELLYGANDRGFLTQWHIARGTVQWSRLVALRDDRTRQLDNYVDEELGRSLPLPFKRRVAAVHELDDAGRFLTAGEDLVIKVWSVPHVANGDPLRIDANVGGKPQIAFDADRDTMLWAIGNHGALSLLDTETNVLLAKRHAHKGDIPGIAISQDTGVVATVGGDHSIRLWRAANDTIVAANIKRIDHTAKLLSVAITTRGDLVAAVDVEAKLGVWRTDNGEPVFLTGLHPESEPDDFPSRRRPLTGRVAFNQQGTFLAAFGASQSGFLFSTTPFRRLDSQIWVAGKGGTALAWNPIYEDMVYAADDVPRYVSAAVEHDFRGVEERGEIARQPCVAMEVTPDGKRIITLEKGGRLVFMETAMHAQLLEMTHPRHFDSDLSIDRSGTRLALASEDGSIEILRVIPKKSISDLPRDHHTDRWDCHELIKPTTLIPRADPRSITFDRDGRFNMLAILSQATDYRDEGELYFLRHGHTKEDHVRERLHVDGTLSDRRVTINATGLVIDQESRPVVVYRRRTADRSPYDGSLHGRRRFGPENWDQKELHAHGNFGFYPFLRLDPDGRPAELRHFSFDGFRLIHSVPNDANESWDDTPFGHVGDGLRMQHAQTSDGAIHFLFQWNPINSLESSKIYARYHQGTYTREVVDSFAEVRELRVTADDQIFVMATREGHSYLLRREADHWVEHCELPEGAAGTYEVCDNGEIYVGPWLDSDTGEILLWHKRKDRWGLEVIAQGYSTGGPTWLHLLQDHRGRPAVVFGILGKEQGWIKLLTLKNEGVR